MKKELSIAVLLATISGNALAASIPADTSQIQQHVETAIQTQQTSKEIEFVTPILSQISPECSVSIEYFKDPETNGQMQRVRTQYTDKSGIVHIGNACPVTTDKQKTAADTPDQTDLVEKTKLSKTCSLFVEYFKDPKTNETMQRIRTRYTDEDELLHEANGCPVKN